MIAKKMIAYFKEDHATISAFLEEINIELVLAEALCQLDGEDSKGMLMFLRDWRAGVF